MKIIADNSVIIVSMLFFSMFVIILLWTYWPANRQRFQEYGSIPLKEDGDAGQ